MYIHHLMRLAGDRECSYGDEEVTLKEGQKQL